MKRKPIAIAVTPTILGTKEQDGLPSYQYAVCNDGTIWEREDKKKWLKQLPNIPQPEEEEEDGVLWGMSLTDAATLLSRVLDQILGPSLEPRESYFEATEDAIKEVISLQECRSKYEGEEEEEEGPFLIKARRIDGSFKSTKYWSDVQESWVVERSNATRYAEYDDAESVMDEIPKLNRYKIRIDTAR